MQKYQRNNIIFRIASAQAISNFKNAQSESFLQLSRKELCFDEISKESVLLEFDRFSFWIMKIERLCLSSGLTEVSKLFESTIVESFEEELYSIELIMDSYPDVFSKNARIFSKIIHTEIKSLIDRIFNDNISCKLDDFYIKLVKIISEYLHFLLLSFHEFNNNVILNSDDKFICVSDFSLLMPSLDKFKLELVRIEFFKALSPCEYFTIKNYSANKQILIEAIAHFDELGIQLIEEVLPEYVQIE